MSFSKIKSCQGLTLIEVLIAGMILAFTLSAFITTFVVSKRSAVMADDHMDKMHEARGVMEELLSHRYTDSELSVGTHSNANVIYTVAQNTAYSNTKDIEMVLSWVESGGDKTFSLSLATSITESLHR